MRVTGISAFTTTSANICVSEARQIIPSAVCVAHTHHVLVDIDTRLVDTAELELVHQVVVHLFAVNLAVQFVRNERCETIGKTFLHKVVAQIGRAHV